MYKKKRNERKEKDDKRQERTVKLPISNTDKPPLEKKKNTQSCLTPFLRHFRILFMQADIRSIALFWWIGAMSEVSGKQTGLPGS